MKTTTYILSILLICGLATAQELEAATTIDYKDYEYTPLTKQLDYDAATIIGETYASFTKIKKTSLDQGAPYSIQPIGYEYDPDTDYYTVYFNIFSENNQPVSTNSIVVSGSESLYEVHTRMQKEAWIEWQEQAGGFKPALDYYIKTYYYSNYLLVCKA